MSVLINKTKNGILKISKSLEQWIKTDIIYLIKGGVWLSSGQMINMGLGLLLTVAFANLLPKDVYGTYQYVISIASIIVIPTLLEMNTSVIRSVARGFEGTIVRAVKTRLLFSLLGTIGGLGLSIYYYLNQNIILSISFLIVALFAPLSKSLTSYGVLPQGKKKFDDLTKYEVISTFFETLIIILFLYITKNIFLVLLAYFIPKIIVRGILLKISIKKHKTNDDVDPEAIPYGKHLSFINIIGDGVSQLDKILLYYFLGPVQVAIYTFAMSPVSRIISAFQPLNTLSFPKIAEADPKIIKKTLPKKVLKLFYILIIPTALYILLAPIIYKLIFPQYVESVIYAQVCALIILFFPQKLLGTAMVAYSQKKTLYMISIIGPITKIILLGILTPILGIWGVIITMMFPYVINLIILLYYFKRI